MRYSWVICVTLARVHREHRWLRLTTLGSNKHRVSLATFASWALSYEKGICINERLRGGLLMIDECEPLLYS